MRVEIMTSKKVQTNPERNFFCGLIKLNYGQKVGTELKKIADKISWAKGWPENKRSFWNAEAFMWQHKIEKGKRELIRNELKWIGHKKTQKNLDLGCGSYSYLSSVGFDISEKMLQFNANLTEKVVGDLEQKLPFGGQFFNSVTAIFVLNYVQNYSLLLSEINRILKPGGKFVMALSADKINDWQRQKEVNEFPAENWALALERACFRVNYYKKERICFFQCTRQVKNVKN